MGGISSSMPAEAAKVSMKPLSSSNSGLTARNPISAAPSSVTGSGGLPSAWPAPNSANITSARTKGAVKPISAPYSKSGPSASRLALRGDIHSASAPDSASASSVTCSPDMAIRWAVPVALRVSRISSPISERSPSTSARTRAVLCGNSASMRRAMACRTSITADIASRV